MSVGMVSSRVRSMNYDLRYVYVMEPLCFQTPEGVRNNE